MVDFGTANGRSVPLHLAGNGKLCLLAGITDLSLHDSSGGIDVVLRNIGNDHQLDMGLDQIVHADVDRSFPEYFGIFIRSDRKWLFHRLFRSFQRVVVADRNGDRRNRGNIRKIDDRADLTVVDNADISAHIDEPYGTQTYRLNFAAKTVNSDDIANSDLAFAAAAGPFAAAGSPCRRQNNGCLRSSRSYRRKQAVPGLLLRYEQR